MDSGDGDDARYEEEGLGFFVWILIGCRNATCSGSMTPRVLGVGR